MAERRTTRIGRSPPDAVARNRPPTGRSSRRRLYDRYQEEPAGRSLTDNWNLDDKSCTAMSSTQSTLRDIDRRYAGAPAVATDAARETTGQIGARLDRLPATRTIWSLVVLISLGGFFEFYELFATAYIAPGIIRSGLLHVTSSGFLSFDSVASFIAASFLGLLIGTMMFGTVADRPGRRSVFTLSLLWYTASAAIMAFQTTPLGLNFWRLMVGIGLGVELVTIDSYLSELVPKHVRGRAFALNQLVTLSRSPGHRVSRVAARPAGTVRLRRLALGRIDGISGRSRDLGGPVARAGKPALARRAWPPRGSERGNGSARSTGRARIGRFAALACCGDRRGGRTGPPQRDIPSAVSFAHADAVHLPRVPDGRALRFLELGADLPDASGNRSDREPRVHARYHARHALRAAHCDVVRRSCRA
ncbi:membrane protein of unknown function (plasmid) [Caballeronia sp. S22]